MCQVFISADPHLYEFRVRSVRLHGVDNFASFLRVCCGRYLALQLSGGIPQDASISISSLNAQRVLDTERWPREAYAPFEVVPRDAQLTRVA